MGAELAPPSSPLCLGDSLPSSYRGGARAHLGGSIGGERQWVRNCFGNLQFLVKYRTPGPSHSLPCRLQGPDKPPVARASPLWPDPSSLQF